MEIVVAKSAGFCFGVKRAMNMASTCSDKAAGEIYTLGPIIHNPQVVKRLEEESRIFSRESVDEIESGTVIVRSHGVRLEEFETAEKKGINIVDATCPFVKKTQEMVALLKKEGYAVVVVGDKEHPEVRGIVSYGGSDITVVNSSEEVADMPRRKKIGIVAQTTQSIDKLEDIVSACLHKASEIKVFNTICNATSVRQKESMDLAGTVDCMIVVGGKNSANTRRLAEICRAIKPATYHIEVADELDEGWIKGASRVGITAGASTPDWIIGEVVARVGALAEPPGPKNL
ncbi:MAG: 4-hydroxy-3-methylbut-2-enyl diphosphate reductase [Thermodesulfobacteriota bacterium]